MSLIDAEPAILTTGTVGGASSVIPTAGTYEYGALRAYIKKNLYATDISREAAHVIVLNASGVIGVAQAESNRLTELGMTVDKIGNAPANQSYPSNKIYRVSDTAKPATEKKLKSLYGVESVSVEKNLPGVTYDSTTEYVIIIAKPIKKNQSSE